jgi:hypothetical protein
MLNNLSLEQIRFLYYLTNYLHVFATGIVIIVFVLTFIYRQIWQFYLVLGLFFLQQAILNGCISSNIQNQLAQPLGYDSINNQFMFGYYNGQYLTYFRVLAGILGTFYLYVSYWCLSNKIKSKSR